MVRVAMMLVAVGLAGCDCDDADPGPEPQDAGGGADAALDAGPGLDAAVGEDAAVDAAAGDAGGTPDAGPCDLAAQTCADGEKCTALWPAFGDNGPAPTCVTEGAVALGETCAVGQRFGDDDCAAGGFCSAHGHPSSDPQVRTCHELCNDATTCDDDHLCYRLTDQPGWPYGVCLPTCAPFADACPKGTACVRHPTTGGVSSFFCLKGSGAAAEGEACMGTTGCGLGLSCSTLEWGAGVCGALCDADHACAAGSCDIPANDTVGVCVPGS